MTKNKAASASRTLPGFESAGQMPDGYYSGDKPNPNLRRFAQENATPYEPEADRYDVPPFCKAITLSRATAVYHMHTYWSKKPHDAICQYIAHHTQPGDLVLDPLCGSGGTALAAMMQGRSAIAIDRSPAATFITANYCTPQDTTTLRRLFDEVERSVRDELSWLYDTRCDRCGGSATTVYTLYSQVFSCPRCLAKVALFDCVEAEGETAAGKPKRLTVCPHCHVKGHLEEISTRDEKLGAEPVLVSYVCNCGCKPAKGERRHNDSDKKKREYFKKYDLGKLKEIEAREIPYWFPTDRMLHASSDSERWGLMWRPYHKGIERVCDFYSRRNLWAMSALHTAISKLPSGKHAAMFNFTSIALKTSLMMAHNSDGIGRIQKGTLYVPALIHDVNVGRFWSESADDMIRGYEELSVESNTVCISTQDSCSIDIPNNSVDYIFTDPPYSWKVQFGELNFIWESWLQMDNSWHQSEIIVNDERGMTEEDWAEKMRRVISECYRVLKPGRWMSLCYHDTSEGTWGLLQDICAEAGFVVDKSETALFIDGTQKSIKQITADQVARRDLLVNFRKPKPGDWRITQVFIPADADIPTFQELGRQVIRDFLTAHPGAPKDRVYDELVSHMVRKGQMEAHDFDTLLRSVAEEVRQPVKENLFDNKEPDLFGSHVASRWYLKETADQIDRAEQAKEDVAAERLEMFMLGHLKKNPEQEGVHYSDLFEQYLPVADKPRRLLADWLPEYFFKTTEGTWRPSADDEERQQKAALRGAGTLRRMKRFANALIDGVPVREQDRPTNDRTLAEWIRQCRRAGLYEQGRALYEKGGLNLESLTDEEQIAVEDDYRICVKRKGEDESKPKRQRRRKGAEE